MFFIYYHIYNPCQLSLFQIIVYYSIFNLISNGNLSRIIIFIIFLCNFLIFNL